MSIVKGKSHKKIDLVGQRFSKLVVLSEAGRTSDGKVTWLCQCDCGNTKIVSGRHLRRGSVKACGCMQFIANKRHGMHATKIYKTWNGMVSRCTNPRNSRWNDYGGRGIEVCDRWKSFEGFYADMGDCPEGMSLDRVDVNGNYEPQNCRWATPKQQSRNRRDNRFVSWRGQTLTVAEWAEKMGMSKSVVLFRLKKWGNSDLDKVFLTPLKNRQRPVTWQGKTQPLSHWAKELGLHQGVLWTRLYEKGWTIDKAFTTPITPRTSRSS